MKQESKKTKIREYKLFMLLNKLKIYTIKH